MMSGSPRMTEDLQNFSKMAYTPGALTAGSLVVGTVGEVRRVISKYSWTNALVAALSGTTGNLAVCTLPAKTLVTKVWAVVTGQAAGVTALTISVGRTSSAYIDYLVAKSAKAAANTIYGQSFTDVGANLSALVGDLPSLSGTTAINLQFVSSIENLSNVTGSAGDIYLETMLIP